VKPSLHPVILGAPLSFEELLALAQKTGYTGVDAGFDAVSRLGPEEFLALCDAHGVAMATWPMNVEWRKDEQTFQEGLKGLGAQAELAAKVNCMGTCTWIPPGVDDDADETRKTWMRRWGQIAKVIGQYGHCFGLEWVAPYHARAGKNVVVWRMTELLEMQDEIGEPNLGLLVDSFHWYNAEQTVADLEALPANKVVHVHINDAPDVPLKDQQDMERLPPGEGIIDLVGFLSALHKIGYEGYMGVEVFGDKLRSMPVEEAAAHAKKGCDELLARVG